MTKWSVAETSTPRGASDPLKDALWTPVDALGPPRTSQGPPGSLGCSTSATLSRILCIANDFGSKTHLRAVTIKATVADSWSWVSAASSSPLQAHLVSYQGFTRGIHKSSEVNERVKAFVPDTPAHADTPPSFL